jgi:peptide deformylase
VKLLTIITHPNDLLTTPCSDVAAFDSGLKALVADMTYTMLLNRGVGLAANQVGVGKRVLVWVLNGKQDYLINPTVKHKSGVRRSKEGCLSFPGMFVEASRWSSGVFSGVDLDGNPKVIEADGLLAVILQHELDHLDGLTFLDRAY